MTRRSMPRPCFLPAARPCGRELVTHSSAATNQRRGRGSPYLLGPPRAAVEIPLGEVTLGSFVGAEAVRGSWPPPAATALGDELPGAEGGSAAGPPLYWKHNKQSDKSAEDRRGDLSHFHATVTSMCTPARCVCVPNRQTFESRGAVEYISRIMWRRWYRCSPESELCRPDSCRNSGDHPFGLRAHGFDTSHQSSIEIPRDVATQTHPNSPHNSARYALQNPILASPLRNRSRLENVSESWGPSWHAKTPPQEAKLMSRRQDLREAPQAESIHERGERAQSKFARHLFQVRKTSRPHPQKLQTSWPMFGLL